MKFFTPLVGPTTFKDWALEVEVDALGAMEAKMGEIW